MSDLRCRPSPVTVSPKPVGRGTDVRPGGADERSHGGRRRGLEGGLLRPAQGDERMSGDGRHRRAGGRRRRRGERRRGFRTCEARGAPRPTRADPSRRHDRCHVRHHQALPGRHRPGRHVQPLRWVEGLRIRHRRQDLVGGLHRPHASRARAPTRRAPTRMDRTASTTPSGRTCWASCSGSRLTCPRRSTPSSATGRAFVGGLRARTVALRGRFEGEGWARLAQVAVRLVECEPAPIPEPEEGSLEQVLRLLVLEEDVRVKSDPDIAALFGQDDFPAWLSRARRRDASVEHAGLLYHSVRVRRHGDGRTSQRRLLPRQ